MESITIDEFVNAVMEVKEKAVTWDRLPIRVVRRLVCSEEKERIFQYFKAEILKGWRSPHFTGRLMLLIKDEEIPPSNSNLRPISISSTIVKTLE